MTDRTSDDFAYRTIDGIELVARLYRPNVSGPAPFVIDTHGGAWGSGDRFNNQPIHEDFAAHGIGVFALDFRLSDVAQFPAPVQDANYGVRWFKANAASLGVEPSIIGGLGSSSGAQQMGLIALQPDNPLYCVPDAALSDVDASIAFFIACWPILDPLARYHMVQENGNEGLQEKHQAYFADESAMAIGNPYLVLDRGDATNMPPIIGFQGTDDSNINHIRISLFARRYESMGGSMVVHKYDGQPHNFVGADPDHADTKDAIARMREFVLAQSG
jgi:acetyl esterase/lipase